jgi:hypothetical protein
MRVEAKFNTMGQGTAIVEDEASMEHRSPKQLERQPFPRW